MTVWIILSGIIAPTLFWIGYFTYKDRFQPEPLRNIGLSYLMGLCSAWICLKFLEGSAGIGLPVPPLGTCDMQSLRFLINCLIFNGLVEELFKFFPFMWIVLRFRAFDEATDGIIYSSTIALGFASFENIGYLPYLEGFDLFGRAFASPLTHTIFSSIWGYAVGRAHLKRQKLLLPILLGLLIAAVCHGIFNFLTLNPTLRIVSSLFILGVWIWRIRILEKAYPSSYPRRFLFRKTDSS